MARLEQELACARARAKVAAAAVRAHELVLQELGHLARNNMQLVIGLLSLEACRAADPAARARLRVIADRVQQLATSHDAIHRHGIGHEVDLVALLADLGSRLQAMLHGPEIALALPAGRVPLAAGQATSIGLFVQEAVVNAARHAFPNGRHGTIVITVEPRPGGAVAIMVADDGIGLPRGSEGGIGLQLLACLARRADARLSIERGGGTRYRLLIAAAWA
jgi:two-component sensor histidine kinase